MWGDASRVGARPETRHPRVAPNGACLLAAGSQAKMLPSTPRWTAFVHNHARAIVACDFVVAVTLRFQLLYVFVIMEVGSRKLLHINATAHPTIHDRSGIFSWEFEPGVEAFGIAPRTSSPEPRPKLSGARAGPT